MQSKTVRLGIIGAGMVASHHLNVINAHPRAEAVGLVTRTKATAETFAKEHGIPHVSTSLREMVETTKPDALMVMVSPDNMHAVCREALGFGIPVFMEKPAGLTPELNRELAELADTHNIPNMVGYNRRFYSVFRKGKEVIERHGPLYGILVEGHERIGAVHASGRFSDETIANWIFANATHTIDLLHFFGGDIESISANAGRWQEARGDQFSATLKFRNKAVGTYLANWLSPGGWRVVLYGDGVTVEFKPLETCTWTDREYKTHQIAPDSQDETFKPGFYDQLDRFIRLVTDESPTGHMDLRQSLKTMELAETISYTE